MSFFFHRNKNSTEILVQGFLSYRASLQVTHWLVLFFFIRFVGTLLFTCVSIQPRRITRCIDLDPFLPRSPFDTHWPDFQSIINYMATMVDSDDIKCVRHMIMTIMIIENEFEINMTTKQIKCCNVANNVTRRCCFSSRSFQPASAVVVLSTRVEIVFKLSWNRVW